MKKINCKSLSAFIISFLLFSSVLVSAQANTDIIQINHTYYTSYFSVSEHIPLVVTYTLTAAMVTCDEHIKRTNRFKADPDFREETNLQRDYTHSGYDRGHNMSAADNGCDSLGMRECFYFSNMTPQPHSFNAGLWEDLEKQERNEAADDNEIIVSIGSIGIAAYIGLDSVVVPQYMWKVIYVPARNEYEAYLFPDADGVTGTLPDYITRLEKIEQEAHVIFNHGTVKLQD